MESFTAINASAHGPRLVSVGAACATTRLDVAGPGFDMEVSASPATYLGACQDDISTLQMFDISTWPPRGM